MTLCNEGTVRDWLRHGKFNVTQGKNFDASGSIGPWMATDVDLTKPLHLTVQVNGEVTQDDTTASMIFGFADLIAYVTTFMTLKPGDVIVTGTPTKKGPRRRSAALARPGDVVELTVPEIGTLRNRWWTSNERRRALRAKRSNRVRRDCFARLRAPRNDGDLP